MVAAQAGEHAEPDRAPAAGRERPLRQRRPGEPARDRRRARDGRVDGAGDRVVAEPDGRGAAAPSRAKTRPAIASWIAADAADARGGLLAEHLPELAPARRPSSVTVSAAAAAGALRSCCSAAYARPATSPQNGALMPPTVMPGGADGEGDDGGLAAPGVRHRRGERTRERPEEREPGDRLDQERRRRRPPAPRRARR